MPQTRSIKLKYYGYQLQYQNNEILKYKMDLLQIIIDVYARIISP